MPTNGGTEIARLQAVPSTLSSEDIQAAASNLLLSNSDLLIVAGFSGLHFIA